MAVFLLTVGSVSLVALWPKLSQSPSPAHHEAAQPPAVQDDTASPPVELAEATGATVLKADGDGAAAGPPLIAPAAVPKQPDHDDAPAARALPQQEPDQEDAAKVIDERTREAEAGKVVDEQASMPNRRPPDVSASASDRRKAPDRASPDPGLVPPATVSGSAWNTLRNARFGFSLSYPADIFVPDPAGADGGAAFRSRDGRAQLVVSSGMNSAGTPLAAYRRSLMAGPYKSAAVDYAPRRAYWFVLSGILGEEIFYERVTLSCDKLTMHSWKLVYPLAERALYDRVVEEVHRRYRHGNGAGGHCREPNQQTTTRAVRPDALDSLSR